MINASITTANTCERAELAKLIAADCLYVADRYDGGDYGFFDLFSEKQAQFVIRIRNDAVFEVLESFPLTDADRKAGVVWDKKIMLGSDPQNRKGPYRLVLIKIDDKEFHLLTNCGELSAELIGLIYRYRWEIETLFKWLKCNLQCRHLLAESQEGVAIGIYLAIIASLLLFLTLGHRPTKRELELIHLFSMGWITTKELRQGLGLKKSA